MTEWMYFPIQNLGDFPASQVSFQEGKGIFYGNFGKFGGYDGYNCRTQDFRQDDLSQIFGTEEPGVRFTYT